MKSGYETAISMAHDKLLTLDKPEIVLKTGARLEHGEFLIPWMGEWRAIESGNDAEKILWLHYLVSNGVKKPTGELISYREVPSAQFYEPKFIARAVRPVVKRFGHAPAALIEAGVKLGGVKAGHGDASVTVPLLPNLPVTYILWGGDEEFPAEGNILFDKCVTDWFVAEDLVVLASLGAYKLVSV